MVHSLQNHDYFLIIYNYKDLAYSHINWFCAVKLYFDFKSQKQICKYLILLKQPNIVGIYLKRISVNARLVNIQQFWSSLNINHVLSN